MTTLAKKAVQNKVLDYKLVEQLRRHYHVTKVKERVNGVYQSYTFYFVDRSQKTIKLKQV